ncbi:MAG: serine hydrolase, partial [Gemmatimonadetes bacterium]|nr:serine hydrolase [Gemmatimonadota bacterium]
SERQPILDLLQSYVYGMNLILLLVFSAIQWGSWQAARGLSSAAALQATLLLAIVVLPVLTILLLRRTTSAIDAAHRRATLRGTIRALAVLLALAAGGCAPRAAGRAPLPPADSLERSLRALVAGFEGDVGIYVRHLASGQTVALAADDTFPTASMIKLPLLCALYERAAAGALHLDSLYALSDSSVLQSDGEDIVAQLRWGEKVPLRKLAFLMMSTSDNTASVWIQALIGGADTANAWLERNGFQVTRDNSRLPARREIWRRWGWGMTTPREIAELLVLVREGRAVSPEASAAMYRLMKGSYWSEEALSAIPPWVGAASKQGAVNRSRSEVLLVESPSGPYVLAVITRNQRDESWGADNSGYVLLRNVSRTVYRHFDRGTP